MPLLASPALVACEEEALAVTILKMQGGRAQEVALIGMLGYLSYLAGELAGLSGIVTLFCCAVAISHYALHNVSAPARVTLVCLS